MQVFGNNGEHAVVAQLWWGNGGAGGIQGDYNWLFGTTLEQARQDPDSITVAKLSFAIDQNAAKDRQANVGLSIERKEFFLNFFLSGKASGARNAGAVSLQQEQVVSGTDDAGIYTQTKTDIATTQLLAQPYSTIVGIHGGHFSDALAARFNGGIDYAKGDQGANQKRVSIGVDKYLGVRGWSLSGIVEHAQNTPVVGSDTSDTRWWLFLRYEFGGGGAFRPFDDSAAANAAWIDRALHEPVTGHARNVDTYVKNGKTTTTTTLGPKQYVARVPIARDDTTSVVQDSGATEIGVLGNDTDPDGNVVNISAAGPASHGTVQVAAGKVLYAPTPGYTGADEFPYTITNSKGLSATATVHITVTAGTPPPNAGAPVARDDTTTTPYAQPVTIAVLGNDSDPNGYPLTVTSATVPAHGAARINGDGTIMYTPNATFVGSDRFSYAIDNGHGGTASANVTIIVQPPAPPVARDDTATTVYTNPVDIDVLANDTDPAGYPLSIATVATPAHGAAKVLTGGSVRYTPQQGFTGVDAFAYTITNGHGGVASANVSVTVSAPTGTFKAQDDAATTAYATAVAIDVLANDSAPAGATLTIKNITTPQHGTASYSQGKIVYTPSGAFNGGTDTFDYTVGDGTQNDTATVKITVLPPGSPVAQDDKATTPFAAPVAIAVLANDSDPDGFTLTVATVTSPAHGAAQINANNTITYTPQATYVGADAFTYTVSNGHGGTASANVAVTVQPPLPPIAVNDAVNTPFANSVKIAVLANDSDPNGLPLSIVSVTAPGNPLATAVINADKTITYTPDSDLFGSDNFTYTISDGYNNATATVTVTVAAPLPPVAKNDSFSIAFDTPTEVNIIANDSDPQNLPLQIINVTQPAHGTVNYVVNTVTYSPNAGYTGPDAFTYALTNGQANSASATVTLNVQLPVPAIAQSFVLDPAIQCFGGGQSCTICLDTHIVNPANLALTVSVPGTASDGGTVGPGAAVGCTDAVVYTSAVSTGANVPVSFDWSIKDVYNRTSNATVSLTTAND